MNSQSKGRLVPYGHTDFDLKFLDHFSSATQLKQGNPLVLSQQYAMQELDFGPEHGSNDFPANGSVSWIRIDQTSNTTRAINQSQQPGSGSRTDAGQNAPHQQLHLHRTGDPPTAPLISHPLVAQQDHAMVDAFDATNSPTPVSSPHGTAQSGDPTCQHSHVWDYNVYANEGAMETESDIYSHFEDAIYPLLSLESSSESPQEQVSHHDRTASKRSTTPRHPEPEDLEIHGEHDNHPGPWSSQNTRGNKDPLRAVKSQLQKQPSDLDLTGGNVPDSTAPDLSHSSFVQEINEIHESSKVYPEPRMQGDSGCMGSETENPADSRTPRPAQPSQPVASGASIQNDADHPAARSVADPSIPGNSTEASTQSLKCPLCPRRYNGKYGQGNLTRHKRLVHGKYGPLKFKCDQCDRSYKRVDARRKHIQKDHKKAIKDNEPSE